MKGRDYGNNSKTEKKPGDTENGGKKSRDIWTKDNEKKIRTNAQRQIWVHSSPKKRIREEIANIDGQLPNRAKQKK